MATTNYDRLIHDEAVKPRPKAAGKTWRIGKVKVSVALAYEPDDWPWLASCDTHSEMLACSTKKAAIAACRHRDWCSGCREAGHV